MKPSAIYTDRGRTERHIIPLIGTRSVKDLTTADLRQFVRDVISGKSAADVRTGPRGRAIVTGGKGTATRTMAFLGTVLSYAVHEGYRPDNPARGIVLPSYEKRKVRLDAAQYAALGRALAAAEAQGAPWQAVEGPYKGLPGLLERIRAAEPSIGFLTPHGLRHSFASVADDLGLTEPKIAALLGHAGGGVTRGYIHKLDAALLAAADKVARFVADAMAGVADAGAEVVELTSARRASAI